MAIEHVASGRIVALTSWGQPQTQALVKAKRFEALRVWLAAGHELPEHQVVGALMLQCVSGQTNFTSGGTTETMVAGDWLHLEGATPHSLRAVTDSVLLMTVLMSPSKNGAAVL